MLLLVAQLEQWLLCAGCLGRLEGQTDLGRNADCSELRSPTCLQLTAPSGSILGQPQTWSGPAESHVSCCKRETVLKTFLPVLTKPKADHLVSWKTIQMQNKTLLKTVP